MPLRAAKSDLGTDDQDLKHVMTGVAVTTT